MPRNKFIFLLSLSIILLISACSKTEEPIPVKSQKLTIFFINDPHAQLQNLAKVKFIIDREKQNSEVLTVCTGDIFSGNPAVDNYTEKGYPMIDLMNQIGFNIMGIGNHDFDYGLEIMSERMSQANFPWICANVNTENSILPQPLAYKSLKTPSLKITFLGLIETNGSNYATIPSTHPWRVNTLSFQPPLDAIDDYADLKQQEDADLLVILSHLGYQSSGDRLSDTNLAENFPFMDLIIGGHSHQLINNSIQGIPIVQAGGYLNKLGKIKLTIKNKAIESFKFELIDLYSYPNRNEEMLAKIEEYENSPELNKVIGYSSRQHEKSQVAAFYTDALCNIMQVDVAFQNTGGIRASLNEGDITRREIFQISPFNNGTVSYRMTVGELKQFLIDSESGFYYSGIKLSQNGSEIIVKDLLNRPIPDEYTLSVGFNDYIAAVHEKYLPNSRTTHPLTAAETLIRYLTDYNNTVDYPYSGSYFRYN